MNEETSVYLDFARFMAALLVMFCHIDDFMVKGVVPFVEHLGVESVGVFFVLSGFVIGFATETKEKDLRNYAVNRAARLYSVVIPCLTLTLLLNTIGKHLSYGHYYGHGSFFRELLHILFAFSFLNSFWILPHIALPENNSPFWSLCYEVPYYAIFGLAWYLRGFWRWLAPLALLLLAGPYIARDFPLWLLGFGLFHLCRRISLKPALGRGVLVSSILLWAGFEALLSYYNLCPNIPAIDAQADILVYSSGICFALSVLGFTFSGFSFDGNVYVRCARAARWLAGSTFTLYLLHFPVAWFLNALMANSPLESLPAALRWSLLGAATFSLALLTAQFTERRKKGWRRWITRLFLLAESAVQAVRSLLGQARGADLTVDRQS